MNRKKKRGKYLYDEVWNFKKSFKLDYILKKEFKRDIIK